MAQEVTREFDPLDALAGRIVEDVRLLRVKGVNPPLNRWGSPPIIIPTRQKIREVMARALPENSEVIRAINDNNGSLNSGVVLKFREDFQKILRGTASVTEEH